MSSLNLALTSGGNRPPPNILSKEGDGSKITLIGTEIDYKDAAWIGPDTLEKVGWKVALSDERPLAIGDQTRKSYTKDIYLTDDSGAICTIVPFRDVHVEYRGNLGRSVLKRTEKSSNEFTSAYGINYINVGIDATALRSFMTSVKAKLGVGNIVHKGTEHEGVVWLNSKLPLDDKKICRTLIGILHATEGALTVGSIVDFFGMMKINLTCDVALAFRVNRSSGNHARAREEWTLGMTLHSCQIISKSAHAPQALSNSVKAVISNRPIDNDLFNLISEAFQSLATNNNDNEEEAEEVAEEEVDNGTKGNEEADYVPAQDE